MEERVIKKKEVKNKDKERDEVLLLKYLLF